MSDDHPKEVTIIVNTRAKKVSPGLLSFEQIVALAFNPTPPDAFFTVTYSHGHTSGSLIAGQKVEIQDGMIFDVTETGKS